MKLLDMNEIQQVNGGSNYTSCITLSTTLPLSAAPIISEKFSDVYGADSDKMMKDLITSLSAAGVRTTDINMQVEIVMKSGYSKLLS